MLLNFTLMVCLVYLVVVCSGSHIFYRPHCLVNFRADFCPLFGCEFFERLKTYPLPCKLMSLCIHRGPWSEALQ